MCNSKDADDRRQFLDEANVMKVMSNPGHQNVIRLFGVHTQSEPLAIVMVWVSSSATFGVKKKKE